MLLEHFNYRQQLYLHSERKWISRRRNTIIIRMISGMHSFVVCTMNVTYFSISGAQCTNSWFQNLYAGFFINSINVINKPQGCGLLTISLSRRTLQNENKTQFSKPNEV